LWVHYVNLIDNSQLVRQKVSKLFEGKIWPYYIYYTIDNFGKGICNCENLKFAIYNLDLGGKYTILDDKKTQNDNHGTQ
jgi:hypothetical protein